MVGQRLKWRTRWPLRHVDMDHLGELCGNYWTVVWAKLGLTPTTTGRVMLAELSIYDRAAIPITAFVGYNSRDDVIDVLSRQLFLSGTEADEFLECNYDLLFVQQRVEERLTQLNGD